MIIEFSEEKFNKKCFRFIIYLSTNLGPHTISQVFHQIQKPLGKVNNKFPKKVIKIKSTQYNVVIWKKKWRLKKNAYNIQYKNLKKIDRRSNKFVIFSTFQTIL